MPTAINTLNGEFRGKTSIEPEGSGNSGSKFLTNKNLPNRLRDGRKLQGRDDKGGDYRAGVDTGIDDQVSSVVEGAEKGGPDSQSITMHGPERIPSCSSLLVRLSRSQSVGGRRHRSRHPYVIRYGSRERSRSGLSTDFADPGRAVEISGFPQENLLL